MKCGSFHWPWIRMEPAQPTSLRQVCYSRDIVREVFLRMWTCRSSGLRCGFMIYNTRTDTPSLSLFEVVNEHVGMKSFHSTFQRSLLKKELPYDANIYLLLSLVFQWALADLSKVNTLKELSRWQLPLPCGNRLYGLNAFCGNQTINPVFWGYI